MPARLFLIIMLLLAPPFANAASGQSYNPLAVLNAVAPEPVDLTLFDQERKRNIPVRIYLPASQKPSPVILFSHGLGGARTGSAYLGKHWSARGYVAIFLQHTGSDEVIWKNTPVPQRMAAMKKAVSIKNFMLRTQDVSTTLDHLGLLNKTGGHALAGRLDMQRIGMSGHSFGAITTQAVSGERFPFHVNRTDARIKAAVMMSPSPPRHGNLKKAFGHVTIPWMLLTGTKDKRLFVNDDSAESRLNVFPALPTGGKYELVLYRDEHSAFSDRPLPQDQEKRNPNHHRAILALTTAFWDAWLKNDPAAKAWLDGDSPRTVLEPQDRWQRK